MGTRPFAGVLAIAMVAACGGSKTAPPPPCDAQCQDQGALRAVSEMMYAGTVRAPDLAEGLDWLNVARPLRLADLRGCLAILDFWTFA